jgi:hypothetical protein
MQLAQRSLKSPTALPVPLVLHQVSLDAEGRNHSLRSRLARSPQGVNLHDHRRAVGNQVLAAPLRAAALKGAHHQRFLAIANFLAGQQTGMNRRNRMGLGVRQHHRPVSLQPAIDQNIGPADVGGDGYLAFDNLKKLDVFGRKLPTALIDSI